MGYDFVADDVVIASRNDLEALLTSMARAYRMVFVAGLPGVGKSLFIRELTRVAHGMGRRPHLLQWDVARPAFVSPAIRARYPDRDGATHPVVRKAIGRWVRKAVLRWHQEHEGSSDVLIGEAPFIGNRLIELAQAHADDAEALLAGQQVLFVTPVPSAPVRAAMESARARTFANPSHARESEDAPPSLLHQLWLDTRALAVEIGAAAPISDPQVPFDPDSYAAVYRHLLRHRNAITVRVDVALEQNGSVYDLPAQAAAIIPTGDEAAESLARLERDYTAAEIEADVARWFHSI